MSPAYRAASAALKRAARAYFAANLDLREVTDPALIHPHRAARAAARVTLLSAALVFAMTPKE